MGLTKTGTDGIKDDAVTLDKLAHGTSGQDGKFLRANNGAAPSFETVSTDLVADTSPQLGGHLESNGYDIKIADGDEIKVGTGNDLLIYHSNNQSYVQDNGVGDLTVASNSNIKLMAGDENSVVCNDDGSVELYHDNTKVFETGANRIFAKARFNINADGINSGDGIGFGQWDGSNHRIEGDSNRPMFITSYNSSGIKLGASGAVKATVTNNGLTFNGDTAAANALDDYEEGTWSPQIGEGSVTTIGNNTYTKIGNLVTVNILAMGFSNTSATSGIHFTNLPFTSASANGAVGSAFTAKISINDNVVSWVGGGVATLNFFDHGTGDYDHVRHNNIQGTDTTHRIFATVTYQAA
jgi:hypothetical protein